MTHPTTAPLGRMPAPGPAPGTTPVAEPVSPSGSASVTAEQTAPEPVLVAAEDLPPEPSADARSWSAGTRLMRFRVRADHHGLRLRAGECVLCVPYEPTALGMVVLVRCESDGHAPGALLSVRELDYVEEAGRYSGDGDWDEPGTRAWPAVQRPWRPAWLARRRR